LLVLLSELLLEKLIVATLDFHSTRKFTTLFKRAPQWFPPSVSWLHATPSQPSSLLFFHLRLVLTCVVSKIFNNLLICSPHNISLFEHPRHIRFSDSNTGCQKPLHFSKFEKN